jgi:hypothetical protein
MAKSREWKSEYQAEYVRRGRDRSSRKAAHTHVISTRPKPQTRAAEGNATCRAEYDTADYTATEYNVAYTDRGAGTSAGWGQHADHKDIFDFRRPRAPKTTYRSSHHYGTTVYSPHYNKTVDYSRERPDPDAAAFRRLENAVDVNPFRSRDRQSQRFNSNSVYRTEFVNYFPAQPPVPKQPLPREAEPPRQPVKVIPSVPQLPFDIESRHPQDEDKIISTYRKDFDDPRETGNPPTWDRYVPDRRPPTDLNPFDIAVGGRVKGGMSTIYRDNYVDFTQREGMRDLPDKFSFYG